MAVPPSERSGDIRTSARISRLRFSFSCPATHRTHIRDGISSRLRIRSNLPLLISFRLLLASSSSYFPAGFLLAGEKLFRSFGATLWGIGSSLSRLFLCLPLHVLLLICLRIRWAERPPLTAKIFMAQHNDFGPPGHGLGFNQEKSTPIGVLFSSAGKYISPGKPYGYSPGRLPSPFSQAKPRRRATSWKPPARWKT